MSDWFHRDLAPGDEGPDVTVLQRLLGAPVTGVFDEDLVVRVRGLQMRMGVMATGKVDKATAKAAGSRRRKGMKPDWFERTIRLWDEGPDVASARDALGLGAKDDRWDPDAEAACRRKQSDLGHALTGEFDEELAVALAMD